MSLQEGEIFIEKSTIRTLSLRLLSIRLISMLGSCLFDTFVVNVLSHVTAPFEIRLINVTTLLRAQRKAFTSCNSHSVTRARAKIRACILMYRTYMYIHGHVLHTCQIRQRNHSRRSLVPFTYTHTFRTTSPFPASLNVRSAFHSVRSWDWKA